MIEGSGRPKNMWIRWIRIRFRIRNTAGKNLQIVSTTTNTQFAEIIYQLSNIAYSWMQSKPRDTKKLAYNL